VFFEGRTINGGTINIERNISTADRSMYHVPYMRAHALCSNNCLLLNARPNSSTHGPAASSPKTDHRVRAGMTKCECSVLIVLVLHPAWCSWCDTPRQRQASQTCAVQQGSRAAGRQGGRRQQGGRAGGGSSAGGGPHTAHLLCRQLRALLEVGVHHHLGRVPLDDGGGGLGAEHVGQVGPHLQGAAKRGGRAQLVGEEWTATCALL
jgi:hypothetical protein